MIKKQKAVYLSGGMQNFTPEEIYGWRNKAVQLLNKDIIVYYPSVMDYSKNTPEEIVEGDKYRILNSTHLLLNFIRPSVGTSQEEIYAYDRGIFVYVINELGKDLSPWMKYHAHVIFPSLEKAVQQINEE